ncbi:hypothetical protein DMB92_01050 [Campylobacter sp. MIT 99-7217]|uniref:L,D-transpeptidase family protein n=1 Tax=Campylobacter sp. MIT 99-7217 TaxID=535091 RepID=UPI0011592E79|nr:murein L,D-transpeptidase family protein [Campylobacter sp. MIT 99-7217]TQR34581.1 hypothetical protein DMB92_01050 [Campylobacter sp. MIT 99-7217]
MLKKIIFFLALTASFLNASDLARIYLNEGLEAVGRELEKELANKSFWAEEIKDKDVSLGYYDEDSTIVLTNKTDKTFKVYFYNNGKLTQEFEKKDVLTGLMGDKEVEGDLKTPIGFYELGRQFDPRNTYYGPFAFATTYPNLYDQLQNKTGGGIWIHGYPLDGTRIDEYKTRGCVALLNDDLKDFGKLIAGRKAVFAMTEEKDAVRASTDDIASILASLFEWKQSWTINDTKTYLSFYDEKDFRRFDRKKFSEFSAMKERIFAKKERKSIKFSKISISPYPNVKGEKMFRIAFYEDYYAPSYQFRGDKLLYVKLDKNGKMKILAEQ